MESICMCYCSRKLLKVSHLATSVRAAMLVGLLKKAAMALVLNWTIFLAGRRF